MNVNEVWGRASFFLERLIREEEKYHDKHRASFYSLKSRVSNVLSIANNKST